MSNNKEAAALAIAEKSKDFCVNYNAGNAEGLVTSYFTEDNFIMPKACPPGGTKPIEGRAGLIAMFSSMFADAPKIKLETADLKIDGNMAFELGRALLTLVDGGLAIGRYTVCWHFIDNDWCASVDFFADDGWQE